VKFTTAIASIHLVKVSIATNKNLNPPSSLGKAPTMSIPQIAKGHESSIGQKELAVPALGADLHHVFLSCRPVEFMSEGFIYD
jgi:hypothetical protein